VVLGSPGPSGAAFASAQSCATEPGTWKIAAMFAAMAAGKLLGPPPAGSAALPSPPPPAPSARSSLASVRSCVIFLAA